LSEPSLITGRNAGLASGASTGLFEQHFAPISAIVGGYLMNANWIIAWGGCTKRFLP